MFVPGCWTCCVQAYAGAGAGSPGHSTRPAVAGIFVRRQAGKAGVCRASIVTHVASPQRCVHDGSSGPLCGTGSVVNEQAVARLCYCAMHASGHAREVILVPVIGTCAEYNTCTSTVAVHFLIQQPARLMQSLWYDTQHTLASYIP